MKLFYLVIKRIFYLSLEFNPSLYLEELQKDSNFYFPKKDGILILTKEITKEDINILKKIIIKRLFLNLLFYIN